MALPLEFPLICLVVLLWLGREELGGKGILLCLLSCIVLLIGRALFDIPPYVFVALLALMDVVLILVIFGGNIRIR
jgi:hypothetical protein